MGSRRHSRGITSTSLLLVALASAVLSPAALAQGDPADAWEAEERHDKRVIEDDPIVPRRAEPPSVPVEPGALPDSQLDPAALDDALPGEEYPLDPADHEEALEPAAHPAGQILPLSPNVECDEDTSERRTEGLEGVELWCADERGRRQGPWVRLWESGTPKVRGRYEGGRRHGLFLAWHPSGQLAARTPYAGGLRQGVDERWYESGKRKSETSFKDDREHGEQSLYFESGQLQVRGQHAMGTPVGRWLWYAEDGSLLREREYDAVGEVLAEALPDGGPPENARRVTLASGAGAAGGAVVGIPLGMLLGFAAGGAVDPLVGFLVFFALPPLVAGAGAAIGAALFSRPPFPVVVGVASAGAMPFGALAGATCGLVVAAMLFADAGIADAAVWAGLIIGGATGAVAAPAAAGALAAWFFAPAGGALE